jgi:hypothetical protein
MLNSPRISMRYNVLSSDLSGHRREFESTDIPQAAPTGITGLGAPLEIYKPLASLFLGLGFSPCCVPDFTQWTTELTQANANSQGFNRLQDDATKTGIRFRTAWLSPPHHSQPRVWHMELAASPRIVLFPWLITPERDGASPRTKPHGKVEHRCSSSHWTTYRFLGSAHLLSFCVFSRWN